MGIFKLSSTYRANILAALFLAFVVLLILPSKSWALSVSPVIKPDGDPTPLDIFAGIGLGYDSNPARTETADSQTRLKAQVGLSYKGGSQIFKYDIGFASKSNMYLDNSDYDFTESTFDFNTVYATRKLSWNLSYNSEQLAEPQDADTIGLPSFERTTTRKGLGVKYNFGQSSISVDYSSNELDVSDVALDYADYTASGPVINFDLGKKSSHGFVRISQSNVDFASFDVANARYDFDSLSTLIGWKSITEIRSITLGVGSQSIEGSNAAFNDASATTFDASLIWNFGSSNSHLKFALLSNLEPSASAQHKEAMRYAVEYERKVNSRSAWSLAFDGEQAKNVDALDNTTDISLTTFSFGYSYSLGSPNGMHGIFYSKFGHEQSKLYDRTVVTVGIALGM